MEGAGVGGLIAEIEGEEFGVGNLAGLWIEAGVLEGLGSIGEPVGFDHGVDEDGFGFGGGQVFGGQGGF